MKYTIRFFTHYYEEEKFIASYTFNSMPFVPRYNDLLSFGIDQYIVKRVATSYDETEINEMLFEVMLEEVNHDKAWWE